LRDAYDPSICRSMRKGNVPSISAYDLPTRDKIPVIRKLLAAEGEGLALDLGSGTGYASHVVFGKRRTVCLDFYEPNLRYYRRSMASIPSAPEPVCVVAKANELPFKNETFRLVLCSEVLEHLDYDEAAVEELARVLTSNGAAIITVPYDRFGFTSFLELCGIKTVHDFPGPEHHVRPGYNEDSLARLLGRHGLVMESHTYYLRFFTRLATDLVSICHLLYQRVIHHRTIWSWSEAAAAEGSFAFRCYTWMFPILWSFSRLDLLLRGMRGFNLVAAFRKTGENRTAG
jgi:SAM-dependent methyltransferase